MLGFTNGLARFNTLALSTEFQSATITCRVCLNGYWAESPILEAEKYENTESK